MWNDRVIFSVRLRLGLRFVVRDSRVLKRLVKIALAMLLSHVDGGASLSVVVIHLPMPTALYSSFCIWLIIRAV